LKFVMPRAEWRAGYQRLYEAGELTKRVEAARELLAPCRLCPRECGVDRLKGERGVCRVLDRPVLSSYGPHFGEEDVLVGRGGSGTIFMAYCNLGCVYCQNWDISQNGEGQEVSVKQLARIMLSLQRRGCENINVVTPTHVMPFVLEALSLAAGEGLSLPFVYNCGGYESLAALEVLDGVVDVYMPDMKYGEGEAGRKYSGVRDYHVHNRRAVKEMHRQVGDLVVDEKGRALRGLIIRHLVLPEGLAGTREVMGFIAREISRDSYVNIMSQYRPAYRAWRYPELGRRVTGAEYAEAVEIAKEAGLWRLETD